MGKRVNGNTTEVVGREKDKSFQLRNRLPLSNDNNGDRIRDFFTISSHFSNCLQHIRSSGQGTIVCKSCATHQTLSMCNMSCATWYKGTAQLLSLTDLNHIYFSFILLAETLTDEGGEETGVPGENP